MAKKRVGGVAHAHRPSWMKGTIMQWDTSLETGIPIVDEQHKELFRQLDYLLDYSNKNRVKETLDFLGNYVVQHFDSEERMQEQSGYPNLPEHKHMHEELVKRYSALKNEYEQKGEDVLVLVDLIGVISDWLKQHIKKEDKDFAVFYKTREAETHTGLESRASA